MTSRTLEHHPLGLGKQPALIVVDVVKGFTDPACPLGSQADSVVAANCTLMEAFHARGLLVVLRRLSTGMPSRLLSFAIDYRI